MEDECCENGNYKNEHEHKHSIEDIAYSSHYKIDALVSLLIKKGLLSEEDYEKELDQLYNKMEEEAKSNRKKIE